MNIIKLESYMIPRAQALAECVFMRFDAPDYSKKGAEGVLRFIYYDMPQKLQDGTMTVYGCFEKGSLLGMCALDKFEHISLLFVDGSRHRQGIGSALVKQACFAARLHGNEHITVNAAPFAVGFYHKIGFVDLGEPQFENDIVFTPMRKSVLDKAKN